VIVKPSFAAIFILIAATLYIYATSLKQMILLGNVIILLLSFSVVIIGVFDLYPAINGESTLMASLFSILLDYAIFAFVINLIRSLEDINGDTSQVCLAIVLGILKQQN
jgi:4-hydroxybenzoate polyprenyltransferase